MIKIFITDKESKKIQRPEELDESHFWRIKARKVRADIKRYWMNVWIDVYNSADRGSGMFIPDPGFNNNNKKSRGKKKNTVVVVTFFSHKFHKVENYSLTGAKQFEAKYK